MALLKDLVTTQNEPKSASFPVVMVHYSKLIPSEHNNYSVDKIKELANIILLSGGVKQNLLARKRTPDEYELIAGHRRRLAVKYLVEELGYEDFAMVPVHVERDGDILSEINLILTNSGTRERNDYEKMREVVRLTELLKEMQGGSEAEQERFREVFGCEPGLGGREIRKLVADRLGMSETKVANLNHINNNLVPELKEKFREGKIGVSAANEAAGLPQKEQKELAEQEEIRIADVKKVAVSDSDTEKQLEPSEMMDCSTRRTYCDALAGFLVEHFKSWFLRDYENRVLSVTESEKQLKERFKETWYFHDPVVDGALAHINLFPDYIQIWDGTGNCLGNTEWFYLCASIQSMWNELALEDAAKMQQNPTVCCENGTEEETEEIVTSQQQDEEPPQTDKNCCEGSCEKCTEEEGSELSDIELLQKMLEKENEFLNEMIKVDAVEKLPNHMLRKKKLLVGALASMLCELDMPEPEEPEQPELPAMKNNDQRKAWLRDYQSWGLWYVDEHIGVRYYKYDFDNGARLIAEVYDSHNQFTGSDYESSYLHLVGGPEPEKHPTGAYGRWNRHETYNKYPNSETELVEFLKAVQKGEKRNEDEGEKACRKMSGMWRN